MGDGVRIPVGLSTASVWPEPAEGAFRLAAELGYDGVEVMVWADPVSQDPEAVRRLAGQYRVPVLAVHAPCLLITQRVWSSDPVERLRQAVRAAQTLDAATVVVHPPFRWQRRYADMFADLVAELEDDTGITVAVENMFPVRPLGNRQLGTRPPGSGPLSSRLMNSQLMGAYLKGEQLIGSQLRDSWPPRVSAFHPSPDPTEAGYRSYTLDLSHAAVAHADAMLLAARMGSGLRHVHLGDGTGAPRDEHLLPGRGNQPCAELLRSLRPSGFDGSVVLEVNTRKARAPGERAAELTEALLFARKHLGPE
ncbi:hypothetical protein C1701_12700 [Actinoalloteichus sp. AHMU CJ021]|uniref:sugar phosphate isomerase/epimerase family protein n=1 Tax=Actinoalloteichus TaxID=65496 RepID=UPI0004AB5091|nr:sugar phosphate isomerase/epimerase [Actinoalloteichus caeruleus]AUS81712.1 hypothetical protein C1701_12700 [Actinoalloteichus sp. AHMU CJ021]